MELSEIKTRILVKDFRRCYDFYTEKLGYALSAGVKDGPWAAFCSPDSGEFCFSMYVAEGVSIFKGYTPLTGSGRTDQAVYFIKSHNVDDDYNLLRSKGVLFMGEPQTIKEWGMRCVYFRDPDGNLFELSQDVSE